MQETPLTLYQLPAGYDLPVSVSAFCAKLELYLRLTGRPYRAVRGNVRKSPTKTVPFVEGLEPGEVVADSAAIIARLEARGPSLDSELSADDRQHGDALVALAEHELYYACLYSRFVDTEGWKLQEPLVRSWLPRAMAWALVPVIRKSQIQRCRDHGVVDASCYGPAIKAIEHLDETLAEDGFLLGKKPHVVDCAVWPNLLHLAYGPLSTPAREAVRGAPKLMAYLSGLARRVEMSLPPLP